MSAETTGRAGRAALAVARSAYDHSAGHALRLVGAALGSPGGIVAFGPAFLAPLGTLLPTALEPYALNANCALAAEQLVAVRRPSRMTSAPVAPAARALFAALRLGLGWRMLSVSQAYLGARFAQGKPLLHQPLVQRALADAVAELTLLSAMLAAGELDARADHTRLTSVGDELSRLCGAAGYLLGGVRTLAYVSRLIGNTYGEEALERFD